MTVVAVEPFVVGLSVLLVVLLSSVIALRPFIVVRSSVLARPSLVSRPSIKLVRTVVRSIVRPSHFAARSISSRSTADRRSLSSLELVALVDGLVSLSGNRLDSSFLFLVLLVVHVFFTLGLAVDVSPVKGVLGADDRLPCRSTGVGVFPGELGRLLQGRGYFSGVAVEVEPELSSLDCLRSPVDQALEIRVDHHPADSVRDRAVRPDGRLGMGKVVAALGLEVREESASAEALVWGPHNIGTHQTPHALST